MIRSKIGQPVTGQDFFDRETEQRRLWESLSQGHVLLLAPRRVGKTSLMLRLKETAADHDLEIAYLSVAGTDDEVELVRKLYQAVSELPSASKLEKLGTGRVARLLRRVRKAKGFELDNGTWKDAAAELAEALGKQGRRLILIDELPVFVLSLLQQEDGQERVRRFLSWFRALRQEPDLNGRLYWLLAGSIGLDTVTARLRLGDTINDLPLFNLGPFDRPTAIRFLNELSASHGFPIAENVLEHALDRIGWLIPYHIQLLFAEPRTHCDDNNVEPDLTAVDAVFDVLLSKPKKAYFAWWQQRLHEELGQPDADYALLLLSTAVTDPNGVTRSTLEQALDERIREPREKKERLRYLIDVLEGDGYLVEKGKRYLFRSPLLREYWLRRVA